MILQNISEGFCSTQRKRNLDVNPESAEKKSFVLFALHFWNQIKRQLQNPKPSNPSLENILSKKAYLFTTLLSRHFWHRPIIHCKYHVSYKHTYLVVGMYTLKKYYWNWICLLHKLTSFLRPGSIDWTFSHFRTLWHESMNLNRKSHHEIAFLMHYCHYIYVRYGTVNYFLMTKVREKEILRDW